MRVRTGKNLQVALAWQVIKTEQADTFRETDIAADIYMSTQFIHTLVQAVVVVVIIMLVHTHHVCSSPLSQLY